MQERVALAHNTQTEHVFNKGCLGVGRVNHILRVHGSTLKEGDSLKAMDEAARRTQDRLFPGIMEEGYAQAALGIQAGGLGWRRATDTARGANAAAWLSACWP